MKLDVFAGKLKKMDILVLRGNDVDREVLICGQLLKKWNLIHPTFPWQTVQDYISSILSTKIKSVQCYDKCNESTDVKLRSVSRDCKKLRDRVLKKFVDIFKDKLTSSDFVSIPPVHLEVDKLFIT